MSTAYDTNEAAFNEFGPSTSKAELIGRFRAWIITTQNDLRHSALRIRREIRDGLPLVRFSTEVAEEHAEFCVELAQVESELTLLDTSYLWAVQNEGDHFIDFSSPSIQLLWERFAAQLDKEYE